MEQSVTNAAVDAGMPTVAGATLFGAGLITLALIVLSYFASDFAAHRGVQISGAWKVIAIIVMIIAGGAICLGTVWMSA